jgi:hypothetical protein
VTLIFAVTDFLTWQIGTTNARVMANHSANPISFPSLTEIRSRAASYSPASPSSPSEAGSPLSRCSITSTSNAQINSKSHTSYAHTSAKQAAALMLDTNVTKRPSRPGMVNRSSLMNRHSYAGLGSARRYPSPPAWAHGLRGAGSYSSSPGSSPRVMCLSQGSDDDMFFGSPMGVLHVEII